MRISAAWLGGVFLVLTLVGLAGMLYPGTYSLMVNLSGLYLLVANLLLLQGLWPLRQHTLLALVAVAVAGWAVEWLGVRTGFPFGTYGYTPVLGPSLAGVPMVIVLNWMLLTSLCVYAARALVGQRLLPVALLAGVLMLGLDLLLEPVAIALYYWVWPQGAPPLQNYVAWGVLGAFFASLLHRHLPARCPLWPWLLGGLLLFLSTLNLVFALL